MKYKIADTVIETTPHTRYVLETLSPYKAADDSAVDLIINTTKEEATAEAEKCGVSLAMGENFHIHRSLARFLIEQGKGIAFHCSSLAVKDKGAVLFTAHSGTGKSTHAKLWRDNFSDVTMINDDKPFLIKREDGFYVCGSPWMGKHSLGEDVAVKIKALCFLERDNKNSIDVMPKELALPKMLDQTMRFSDVSMIDKLFEFLDGLMKNCEMYLLKCNMNSDAALVARQKIFCDVK